MKKWRFLGILLSPTLKSVGNWEEKSEKIMRKITYLILVLLFISCDNNKQKSIIINYWKLNNTDFVIEDTFQVLNKSYIDIKNFDEYKKYYPNIEKQIKINFDNLISNKPVHFKEYSLNNCELYLNNSQDTIIVIGLNYKNIDAEDYFTYSKKYGIITRLYYHKAGYTIFKRVLIKGQQKKEILFDSLLTDLSENSHFWYFGGQ